VDVVQPATRPTWRWSRLLIKPRQCRIYHRSISLVNVQTIQIGGESIARYCRVPIRLRDYDDKLSIQRGEPEVLVNFELDPENFVLVSWYVCQTKRRSIRLHLNLTSPAFALAFRCLRRDIMRC